MKDAKGHGSNPHKITSVSSPVWGSKSLARVQTKNGQKYDIHGKDSGNKMPQVGQSIHDHPYAAPVSIHSGHSDLSLNAAAASALASGPKSAPVPIHDALRGFSERGSGPGKTGYDSYNAPGRPGMRRGTST